VDPGTLRAIADAGFAAGLIAILLGGFRGWWIYGPLHDRIVDDLLEQRNFWRDQAIRATRLAEVAVDQGDDERRA
jgi:hypothetical protein